MFKIKMLIGLTGIFAVLGMSATPAFAEWQAKGQWKGPVRVTHSGSLLIEEGAVKAEVSCPENEINATWSIQSKGQIKIHEKEGKQVQAKQGPHLNLQIKWGKACVITVNGSKTAATVSECELQLVQASGSFKATGGVVKECIVKGASCEIKAPAGMEKAPESGEGVNVGLKEVELVNKGNNQFDKTEIKGVFVTAGGTGCLLGPHPPAFLKGLEFEVEGATVS
jgi:hypothetical protein